MSDSKSSARSAIIATVVVVGLLCLAYILMRLPEPPRLPETQESVRRGHAEHETVEPAPIDLDAAKGEESSGAGGAPVPEGEEVVPVPNKPLFTPSSPGEFQYGIVLVSALNVRQGPSVGHPKIGILRCGDLVSIIGSNGAWWQVRMGDLAGYSHGAYVVPIRERGVMPECLGQPNHVHKDRKIATVLQQQGRPTPAPDFSPVTGKPSSETPRLSPPAATSAPEKGGGTVVLRSGQNNTKSVTFPHHQHNTDMGLACVQCHHPLNKGASTANSTKNCHSCHVRAGETGKVQTSPKTNKEAFHGTCIECHKVQGGPKSCKECHAG